MKTVLPFLKPLCLATDQLQRDDTSLRDLHSIQRNVEQHIADFLSDPVCPILMESL